MNPTDTIFMVLGIYLLVGVLAILILDLLTSRVRSRIKGSSLEVQVLIGENRILAIVITILALWIFWPLAIYSAIRG